MGKNLFIKILPLILLLAFFTGGACPNSTESLLDDVKNLLDNADYENARIQALLLVDAEDNATNRRLLASAYLGEAGLTFLDLAEKFTGLTDTSVTVKDMKQIACAANLGQEATTRSTKLASLRSAIEALEALGTGTTGVIPRTGDLDAAFELGLLQAMEAFILPTNKGSTPPTTTGSTCEEGTFTVDNTTLGDISIADTTNVQTSFVRADNNLVNSGLDADNVMIDALRQNFCPIKAVSAGSGFTQADLQAFTYCQLAIAEGDTTSTIPGTTGHANCGVFTETTALNPNAAALTTCLAADDLAE